MTRDWTTSSHFGQFFNEYPHATHAAAWPHGINAMEIRFKWQTRHWRFWSSAKKERERIQDEINGLFDQRETYVDVLLKKITGKALEMLLICGCVWNG